MPYVHAKPLSQAERAVMAAGYRWVQTNTLYPHTPGTNFDAYRIDRLQPHGHHSTNTHVVLDGSLTISRNTKGRYMDHSCVTLSADPYDQYKELQARVGTRYRGWAGPQGCTFVEGHMVLSPTTQERFLRNGTIKWVDEQEYFEAMARELGNEVAMHEYRYGYDGGNKRSWLAKEQARVCNEPSEVNLIWAGLGSFCTRALARVSLR